MRDSRNPELPKLNQALLDHYRCPECLVTIALAGELSTDMGYFRFGPDVTCYGKSSVGFRAARAGDDLFDAMQSVRISGSTVNLPFSPTEVINNLRCERYSAHLRIHRLSGNFNPLIRRAYYFVRPLLSVSIRKRLQKIPLRDWQELVFPNWPVDFTVDNLLEKLVMLSMKTQRITEFPFIWFWPDNAPSCLMMTHDVETKTGVELCSWLMETNERFGIKASFQFIPEKRYAAPQALMESIRKRGFEIGVHDLNHDGDLFRNWDEFVRRAEKINRYGREYGARGFRSGAMYRNQDWYDVLDFQYDMSVPNVAHLDPQRGGCCTVMPYFIGKMLELPVTVIQDYQLFNLMDDYSIELWKRQIQLIMEKHGLIHFITHPDYMAGERARQIYIQLLQHISRLRDEHKIWIARPQEVNDWWRQRAQLSLTMRDGKWIVSGPDSERARPCYAFVQDRRLTYDSQPRAERGPVAGIA